MTIMDFLQDKTDKSNFDMLTIIGIDKTGFIENITSMLFNPKYDTMTCKEFRKIIENMFNNKQNTQNTLDYVYTYQNYILKDMNCIPKSDTKKACYDGRSSFNNNRDYIVPIIIKQMQSSNFCQKHLFLLKDILCFKYHKSGYDNDSPNQVELRIYCWLND